MRVAVIGGGFSGTAFALQLARRADGPVAIDIIEPRPQLGGGVAYSSSDPAHRINVPAARMTIFADDEGHFDRWIRREGAVDDDPAATLPDDRIFPRRAVFGRYVRGVLQEALALSPARLAHIAERAQAIHREGAGYRVTLSGGGAIEADLVVLATSHPPPAAPAALAPLAGLAKFIADPWAPEALAAVGPDDRVLIVGTGLTMADIVASLERRGHRGSVVAVSRRGLLSRGHPPAPVEAKGDFATRPAVTALELLRRIRRAVDAAGAAGLSWHGVLDAVRRDAYPIWRALPVAERSRLVRHLRAFWDVHRYRVAPQVEAAIARAAAQGRFQVIKADLGAVVAGDDGIVVDLRPRKGQRPAPTRLVFDAVVVATGPAHGSVIAGNPALASLAVAGLVTADAHGLGLAVDLRSHVLDADGKAQETLLVAGPLARGTFGELMGLPQVALHAEQVAEIVAEWLRRQAPAAQARQRALV
ncbi:hypothetical protein D3874_25635 [Oleomonas cavernae]|uniref:FAD-dependent urate hydroxylase HpyO/Asp monooxygenase CreE-like FAD/NAD(P)-binding domain-containing protein n=2 Tax=Oleomonas cavernae TaxID=2320859 RepID=A0A418VUM7_9PROT|nr:hypothetical protein D3874_25635 [Oleomonas cavernae]